MKKEIYIIKGSKKEKYAVFSERMLKISKSLMDITSIRKIKLTYTKDAPPTLSIIPFKKKKIAVISVFKDNDAICEELTKAVGFSAIYSAEEAIPVAYKKDWADLEATAGVCLLTLFKQKKGITYDTFIDRWHNSHTPLSLKIHPLWNYNRNVATCIQTNDSDKWDGIVEEQFIDRSTLLNPIKFFGHPLIMPYRMWQVYSDTKSFLDYKSIEPYFATEIHIKS